jgi:hypothetical protein
MRHGKRTAARQIVLVTSVLLTRTISMSAQVQATADPLAPVAFLAGGTWIGAGRWPDGSTFAVEEHYFWGPTKHLLHFEAYEPASDKRTLLYEGIVFYDAARQAIVQWNVKPSGERNESVVTRSDSSGYEVRGAKTWSLNRRTGADEYHWELRVRQDTVWKTILDATYRRTP